MLTRYTYMKATEQVDAIDEERYPDPISIPYYKFMTSETLATVTLSDTDILQLPVTLHKLYGAPDLLDVVLMLNEIPHVNLIKPGDSIYLPSLTDIVKTVGNG